MSECICVYVSIEGKIRWKGCGKGVFLQMASASTGRDHKSYNQYYIPVRTLMFNQGLGNLGRRTAKARPLRAPGSDSQFQLLPRMFILGVTLENRIYCEYESDFCPLWDAPFIILY